jgi:hypothetical protein
VFAAVDVTSGETLVVKAISDGREAVQRIQEFLTEIPMKKHFSIYDTYFRRRATKESREDGSVFKRNICFFHSEKVIRKHQSYRVSNR